MKQFTFFLINFMISAVLLIVLMVLSENPAHVHIFSLLAILVSTVLCCMLESDGLVGGGALKNTAIAVKSPLKAGLLVVILNLLVCLFSVFLLAQKINFDSLSTAINGKNLFLVANFITVFIVQFGGWFLQAILLYFVNIVIDGKMKFKDILSLTGIAYIGFLLFSIILLIYSQYTIRGEINLNDFSEYSDRNIITPSLAKIGEYLTLMVLAMLIYKHSKNLSRTKALLMATIPSFVILLFEQILKYAL